MSHLTILHPQLLNIVEEILVILEEYVNKLHEPMVQCVLTSFNYVYLVSVVWLVNMVSWLYQFF